MASSVHAAANMTFGVTAETGLKVQSYSYKASASKKEAMDESGDYIAVAHYGFKGEISFEGFIASATPKEIVTIGETVTVANSPQDGWGVTAGGIIVCDGADFTASNEDFNKLSTNASHYPEIAA